MLPSICIRRAPLSFSRGPSLLHASFNTTKCRTQRLSLRSLYELSWQSARRASTVSPKAKPKPKPEPAPAPQKPFRAPRLIVYHAGTPRIMFLGGLKISAFFVMGFFSFVTVPSFAESGAPLWQTLGVMVAGAIPLLAVWYLTSPMVMWIHFIVPKNFQRSADAVELLMKNVPIDAEVTMTTMGILGKPRVSHMKLRDVRKERRRFGLVNHVRTLDQDAIASRKWYQLPEMSQFKIEDKVVSNRKTKQLWMWYAIWHTFQQKQARMSRRQQGQSSERIR